MEATVVSPKPYALGGVSAVVNGIAAPVLFVSPTQVNIQIPYEAGAGPAVLGLNNDGEIAGFAFQMAPAAPGIRTDADGMLAPQATVQTGKVATLFLTGRRRPPGPADARHSRRARRRRWRTVSNPRCRSP